MTDEPTAHSTTKEAVALLAVLLRKRGFVRKGNAFVQRTVEGNTAGLAIQRSQMSTSSLLELTLNYGIHCGVVGAIVDGTPDEPVTDIGRMHWRKRISENGQERWLRVSARDSATMLGESMCSSIEPILDELSAVSTNAGLCDEWSAGRSPGATRGSVSSASSSC